MKLLHKLFSKHNLPSLFTTVLVFINLASLAQGYKIDIGSSITTFTYTQANGEKADYLKPSPGSHFGISVSQAILDTNKNLSNTSKRSIYFSQHPKISKVSSFLNYDIGFHYLQMNTVGDL